VRQDIEKPCTGELYARFDEGGLGVNPALHFSFISIGV